jgi:hypothetical protein
MADEQQIQNIFERLRSGADLTAEQLEVLGVDALTTGDKIKNAGVKTAVALEKAGVSLSRGIAGFASGVAKGETSFKSLNPVIDGVTGALGEMAKIVPFAGNAVAGALKLAAEGSKFLLDQLESATKSFQEMSRVGALTSSGMTGLREQFLRSGQTLQGFQKTVSANADTLARFGGTAGAGAERFSEIVGSLTLGPLTEDLRRIGFTADDIGEATAAYIQQQTRLGQSQNKTQAQLIQGSKEYAENLDVLAKLTGQSRAELQKQQDAALSESRFRAATELLVAEGNEKGAKALLNFQSRFAKIAPGISQGIRDSLTNANTEAAKQLFQSTGGASRDIIERLKAGIITEDQATSELQDALRATSQQALVYASNVGEGVKQFVSITEQQDVINATMKDGVLTAKETQKQQQKSTDPMTAAAVKAQVELEKMNRGINQLAFNLLPAAATAVATFTTVLNKGLKEIGAALGIDIKSVDGGGGESAGGVSVTANQGALRDLDNLSKMSAGQAAGSAAARTIESAGSLTAAGFKAVGAETVGGWIEKLVKKASTARIEQESLATSIDQLVDFGNESGSKASFEKLNGDVQLSFLRMANEYQMANNGKKLKINSAFRDPEKQKELYAEYQKRGFTGIPVAKPGTSLHERGYAIDLDQNLVSELTQTGLLNKYGFQHNPKDPVHIFQRPGFASSNVRDDSQGYRDGGIASGPESGYAALLHGMEAIVPLSGNRSIPVSFRDAKGPDIGSTIMGQELPRINEAMNRQSEMLQKQLEKSEAMIQALNRFASGEQLQMMISKLDTLGDKMSTSNDINSKILQVQM